MTPTAKAILEKEKANAQAAQLQDLVSAVTALTAQVQEMIGKVDALAAQAQETQKKKKD